MNRIAGRKLASSRLNCRTQWRASAASCAGWPLRGVSLPRQRGPSGPPSYGPARERWERRWPQGYNSNPALQVATAKLRGLAVHPRQPGVSSAIVIFPLTACTYGAQINAGRVRRSLADHTAARAERRSVATTRLPAVGELGLTG